MPPRGRSRNRGESRNTRGSSRGRRQQADQNSSSSRPPDRFQVLRRSARLAQHHEDLIYAREEDIISEVTASMTDYARHTYPRSAVGPRVVDTRVNRTVDNSQRTRQQTTSVPLMLDTVGARTPSRVQTNHPISMKLAVLARSASQSRHVNPQALVAVVTLVDNGTGAPLPAGYLVSGSSASRAKLVQPVGPSNEINFEGLLVKHAGTYRMKVTLLRMPEASATGGQATHVAEWASGTIKVEAAVNGA